MSERGSIPPARPAGMSARRRIQRWFAIGGGGALLLVGVALLVLPGPGVLVILFAMSILATELPWARAYQDKLRALLRLRRMRKSIPPPPPAPPPPENE